MDELESQYEELEPKEREQRLEMMEIMGASGVYFTLAEFGDRVLGRVDIRPVIR